MKVNICGVPYTVVEKKDNFDGTTFGSITYAEQEIIIREDLRTEIKAESIIHEMVHGMFVHLGYNDYASDEQLVQALANAIYQGFTVKVLENEVRGEVTE